jgi:hypothetical protein
VFGRHRLQLGLGLSKCDEVVVMELGAPAFVRGVLREHSSPHGVTDRVLPSGIGADLAAEHADRIGPLLQRICMQKSRDTCRR